MPNFGALAAGAAAPGGAHGAGSANPNPNPNPNAHPNPNTNPNPNPNPNPIPNPNPTAAEDEAAAFAGFDGFEADPEVTMEHDERSDWSSRPHGGAATHTSVGGASAAHHSAGATA